MCQHSLWCYQGWEGYYVERNITYISLIIVADQPLSVQYSFPPNLHPTDEGCGSLSCHSIHNRFSIQNDPWFKIDSIFVHRCANFRISSSLLCADKGGAEWRLWTFYSLHTVTSCSTPSVTMQICTSNNSNGRDSRWPYVCVWKNIWKSFINW